MNRWNRCLPAIAVLMCAGCDAGTPTTPRWVTRPSPPPAPDPAPPPPDQGPHRIEVVYEPDMWNTPAPQDADGSYLLDWSAGWYCVWVNNVPHTSQDRCREYTLAFSWLPDGLSVSASASGGTWSRGCQSYPSRSNPGTCFSSPPRASVGALQSISIVARERTPGDVETEVFRTELAIKFRDGGGS